MTELAKGTFPCLCLQMIIVSKPEKPFTYTAKGTPRRPAIINEYQPEIEALYATVDETTQAHLPPPRSWNPTQTIDFVRSVVHEVMKRQVADEDDLFQRGCDRYVRRSPSPSCAVLSAHITQPAGDVDTQLGAARPPPDNAREHPQGAEQRRLPPSIDRAAREVPGRPC